MILKKTYIEYLLNTPINYTCSNLSSHLEGVSHDTVTDFLANSTFEPSDLWDLVKHEIDFSKEGVLIVDDSVQDKRYSRFIELVKRQYSGNEKGLVRGINLVNMVYLVKRQYSGNEKGLVRGINLVNMVYSEGLGDDFYPVDYRVYAPSEDSKTKNDHFREMFREACENKMLPCKTIVFDSWYGSAANLKYIHFEGWTFFTTLKSNRKVSLSKETGYVNLEDIDWRMEDIQNGIVVKLKTVPFLVKLFLIVHKDASKEYVITNYLGDDLLVEHVEHTTAIGIQIEEFHRSFKQLTGSEKCQCRKAKSQRNHFACCYHAWVSLKKKAKMLQTTLYDVRTKIFEDFLKKQLANPFVEAI